MCDLSQLGQFVFRYCVLLYMSDNKCYCTENQNLYYIARSRTELHNITCE